MSARSARSAARRRRFRRRGARRDAPPRRGARPALPRHLRGRSRRSRNAASTSTIAAFSTTGAVDPHRRRARPRGGGSRRLCGRLVHWRQARLAHAAPMPGSPSRSRRTGVAGGEAEFDLWQRAPRPDRRRRHVPRHRRLRQALRHLPREIRQRRRISAASRTCPATISSCASPAQGEPGIDGGSFFR